jgi:tetratricopeptide (TPR) repeat protein
MQIVKAHKGPVLRREILLCLALLAPCFLSAETPPNDKQPKALVLIPADDEFGAAQDLKTVFDKTTEGIAKKADPNTSTEEIKRIETNQAAMNDFRDAAVAKHSESALINGLAAAAAVQAGDLKKGDAYATKAIALSETKKDPQMLGDALQTRAIGALQAGDYVKAESDAKRLLELRPNDKNARMLFETSKGRAKSGAPPAQAATKTGSVAVAPWPADVPRPSVWEDPRVKMAGQRAVDRQAAIKKLNDALGHLQANRPQEALAAADAAQRHDPTLADAYMQKAMAWSALNELAKALIEVTKAIGLWTVQGKSENLPAAYALRAQIDNGLADYPAALSDADKALVYNRSFAPGWFQRATAGEKIGKDVERALEDYKRAAELDPNFRASYEDAVVRLSAATDRKSVV